jgi:serine/threonine protein kinase
MSTLVGCPTIEVLRNLADGQLDGAEKDTVSRHITICERCAAEWRRVMGHDTMFESRPSSSANPALARGITPANDTPGPKTADGVVATEDWFKMSQGGAGRTPDSLTPSGGSSQTLPFLAPPEGPDELGRLAGYRVRKRLGEGGMGLVLLAEDIQLKRDVALKVMRPALAENPDARQRFLREGQAMAAIQHDHIVTIYQVGDADGVPFLAMQLLTGMPLDEWLRQVPRPSVAQVVRIGKEIARGLTAAHERGLIHRDIKPANIWLEAPSGRVKILDFGLARVVKDATHVTKAGNLIGTPAYMAPEQVQDGEVDCRSDLFSLGVVMYELCTGRRPFPGADPLQVIAALALADPPPIRQANPDIPDALADLVTRLLAKDRAQRPESARHVVEALLAIERQLASDRRKTETPTDEHTAAPAADSKRSRWPAAALGIGVLTAVVLAGIILLVPTPKGTLEISTDDPDVKVIVEQAGKRITIIDPKSNQQVELDAGTYQLKLDGGKDLKLETDTFSLIRGGKKIVQIRRVPPPDIAAKNDQQAEGEASLPAIKLPERGFVTIGGEAITDFLVIHNATLDDFKAWLEKLKTDSFHPVFLSVPNSAAEAPRFNAIAVKDGKNVPWEAHFDWLITDWEKQAGAMRGRQMRLAACGTYGAGADRRAATVWVGGSPDAGAAECYFGSLGDISGRIADGGKRGLRPLYISVQTEANGESFASTVLIPDNGLRGEYHDDLAFGQVKKLCEECPARGMRLDHLCSYGRGDKVQFAAILVENRDNIDPPIVRKYMQPEEYEDEVLKGRRRGLRPLTLTTYVDEKGRTKYAGLFLRYRMDFEVWQQLVADLPPKQQIDAVLDKLKERNPAFDREMLDARFKKGEVQEVDLYVEKVGDLAPLSGLRSLKKLTLRGSDPTKIKSINVSALAGMKLLVLHFVHVQPKDLTPLKDMPLEELRIGPTHGVKNAAALRQMPNLRIINGKPAEDFFKDNNLPPPNR